MPRTVNVTPDLLQAGHAELEQRHRWGASFDEVMADPVRSRLVRATAVAISLRRRLFTKHTRRRTQALRERVGIDAKSAAAGEREDA